MADPLWITVLVFLALLMARNPSQKRFAILCAAGIGLIVTLSSVRCSAKFHLLHDRNAAGRAELFRLGDDSKLRILYDPDPNRVREWAPILQKRRLSVFRNLTT